MVSKYTPLPRVEAPDNPWTCVAASGGDPCARCRGRDVAALSDGDVAPPNAPAVTREETVPGRPYSRDPSPLNRRFSY